MSSISNWMHVDIFTVEQAAALWCEYDPSQVSAVMSYNPSEVLAIKQMLSAAIEGNELSFDSSKNALSMIGDHSKTMVTREALENYARRKNLFPAFLFDTLLPFKFENPFQFKPLSSLGQTTQSLVAQKDAAPRTGRPREYDWDAFTMEIIRRANHIDGLPDRQSQLVSLMLQWFSDTYDREPAESAVKSRISKIYRYLSEGKKSD